MKVLILSQMSAKYIKMNEWGLDKMEHEFHIIVPERVKESYKDLGENVSIYVIDSWSENSIILKSMLIMENTPCQRIFAIDEFDIDVAANLRKYFSIEGQNIDSATFFRNKLVMNKIVRENGFNAPITKSLGSILDIFSFGKKNGYPLIIKPIDGAGTMETYKINSEDEIRKYGHIDFHAGKFIIQNFIQGDLYHIDGFIANNELRYVKPSRYLYPTLAHLENKSTASIQLDREDEVIFSDYLKELIERIPVPRDCLLHLEVFFDGEDIYFLEIASRLGGGGVHDIVRDEYGIDPVRASLLAEIGDYDEISVFEKNNSSHYGFILVNSGIGKLVSLPDNMELISQKFDVIDTKMFAKVGREYKKHESSVQAICRITLKGETEEEILSGLDYVDRFVRHNTLIV
ncbi:hypothetical protein BG261_08010 [Floricoccus tropicus]|uniref:ATP-grasp domain-containing protein n=1 Tax=Floricoccus tropicus TaxID=1859473 RepID=A0A1E8GL13_9LACT|nr:ATP-grasp domain-containing protein [Floricoccus tropicus]OFI48218.1 hypothetical protein BG261_08010 [Floricoccus tropicus]